MLASPVRLLFFISVLFSLFYTQLLHAAGVTIITHGDTSNADSPGLPGWTTSMANAIAQRSNVNAEIFNLKIGGTTEKLVVESFSIPNDWSLNDSDIHSAEIIIVIDWSQYAKALYQPFPYQISSRVAALVASELINHPIANTDIGYSSPLAELPIHLIGHSRGTAVNSEIARHLGSLGIWVDQMTTLDPHPSKAPDIDEDALVYENVIFADNYHQEQPLTLLKLNPYGERISGAHNRFLNDIVVYDESISSAMPHSLIHTYYHGTINLHAIDDGEGSQDNWVEQIQDRWYDQSLSPFRPKRAETGFNFGRFERWRSLVYNKAFEGLHPEHPRGYKNTHREILRDSTPRWPNVLLYYEGNDPLVKATVGETIPINIIFQDSNNAPVISLWRDYDQNPFNPGMEKIGGFAGSPGDYIQTHTYNWNTDDNDVGNYFIYAKAEDGFSTRYYYLPNGIVVSPPANENIGSLYVTPVEDFSSSGNQGGPFDPPSKTYTLKNTGGSSLNWTATNGANGADFTSLSGKAGTLLPGETTTVTARLNSKADFYRQGTELKDRIHFSSNENTIIRNIDLEVISTSTDLLVEPSEHFKSAGTVGGPFNWTSKGYLLTNTLYNNNIDWRATLSGLWGSNAWITLSSSTKTTTPDRDTISGTLIAQDSVGIQATLNNNAYNLPSGTYSESFEIVNENNFETFERKVTLSVFECQRTGDLCVTPSEGLITSGIIDGPFTPGSASYTVVNLATSDFDLQISNSEKWVSVSPSDIELQPGEPQTINVNINYIANSLLPNHYNDTVYFRNSGSGNATSRPISLTVKKPTCTYSFDVANNSLSSDGGDGSVNVTVVDECDWTATSNNDWIAITSGHSGIGDGSVSYSVDPNPSNDIRLGTLNIAGQTFAVMQAGLPSHTLTISVTGNGTVISDPMGIDCGTDCLNTYNEGTAVTLNTVPDTGSSFVTWSGDADCLDGIVTMDTNKTCTASFIQTYTLTVLVTGNGVVISDPVGVDCGIDCLNTYNEGTVVTLNTIPDADSNFVTWSGDADCLDGAVTMDMNKTCAASFDQVVAPPTSNDSTPPVTSDSNRGGSSQISSSNRGGGGGSGSISIYLLFALGLVLFTRGQIQVSELMGELQPDP